MTTPVEHSAVQETVDALTRGSDVEIIMLPVDGNGVVNGADLAILASAWGTADPIADLNGDGEVNGADLSILLGNWTG